MATSKFAGRAKRGFSVSLVKKGPTSEASKFIEASEVIGGAAAGFGLNKSSRKFSTRHAPS
jgi:hypothetical protein